MVSLGSQCLDYVVFVVLLGDAGDWVVGWECKLAGEVESQEISTKGGERLWWQMDCGRGLVGVVVGPYKREVTFDLGAGWPCNRLD